MVQRHDGRHETGGLVNDMRLIDETEYQELLAKIPMDERTFRKAVEVAEDMPTIDAVPVVRCRECKHYRTGTAMTFTRNGEHIRCCSCEKFGRLMRDDDFCSYGKRKGG